LPASVLRQLAGTIRARTGIVAEAVAVAEIPQKPGQPHLLIARLAMEARRERGAGPHKAPARPLTRRGRGSA
jgi:hypothetical protein